MAVKVFMLCVVLFSLTSAQNRDTKFTPEISLRIQTPSSNGETCVLQREWAQLPVAIQNDTVAFAIDALKKYRQGPSNWIQYRVRLNLNDTFV